MVAPNPLDNANGGCGALTSSANPYASYAAFPAQGPYPISAIGEALTVLRASPSAYRGARPAVALTLQAPPGGQPPSGGDLGYVGALAVDASAGDKALYISPLGFWWLARGGGGYSFPGPNHPLGLSQFPLLLRGPAGAIGSTELLVVTAYSAPAWTCDPARCSTELC